MKALWRLENGGIRFELTTEGKIAYENTWPDDVPDDWFSPLMAEVRARRDEVVAILTARRDWMSVYDEWNELLEQGMDDFERDVEHLERMQDLAIRGQLGCFDGEDIDLGAEGWELVTKRQIQVLAEKEKQEMGIKIEQTTYDAVPTGEYKAVITEISPAEGKFGPQLQIKSEINDGPYAGNTFLCWVSPKFSPKSRLYEWVEAALAMPVPKSYTFDSDHLIGREVIATLVVRELDGGGEVNRVDRVRAVPKAQERLALGG